MDTDNRAGAGAFSPEAQIAWAAGLFEGEGCWNVYYRNGGRTKISVVARLAMTDRDAVEKFAAIVGFGTMRQRNNVPANEKPVTEWYTQRRSNVRLLIEMFMPHLCERRKARALEIMAVGEAFPKNERTHCPQGHAYEGDNLVLEPIVRAGKHYFARRCKICRADQARERQRKRRGSQPERFRV